MISIVVSAGCAATQTKPVAATKPVDAAPVAVAPPRSAGPADDATAVVDSVNDNVARVSRILAQRAEAQQAADDLREQRGTRTPPPAATAPSDKSDVVIERLAAEIRALKDKAGEPALPAPTPDDAVGTLATPPTKVEVRRNGQPSPSAPSGDPLAALDAQFAGKVAQDPKDLDSQLDLQLLRYLANDPVPTQQDLSPLPADDRELVASVVDALSNFRNVVRASPNPMTSEKARPFVDMADRIRRAVGPERSQTSSLCTAVRALRQRTSRSSRFGSSSGHVRRRAVFYCEVDGFQSTVERQAVSGTRSCRSGLKLLQRETASNCGRMQPEPVTRQRRAVVAAIFSSRGRFELPSSLTPGRYLS